MRQSAVVFFFLLFFFSSFLRSHFSFPEGRHVALFYGSRFSNGIRQTNKKRVLVFYSLQHGAYKIHLIILIIMSNKKLKKFSYLLLCILPD
jgi:hypothetical protein